MSPNIELVRRWYALLPSLGGSDPNDDSAFLDRVFRDYLDEEYEVRLPGGYPEGEPAFKEEGFATCVYRDRSEAIEAGGLQA